MLIYTQVSNALQLSGNGFLCCKKITHIGSRSLCQQGQEISFPGFRYCLTVFVHKFFFTRALDVGRRVYDISSSFKETNTNSPIGLGFLTYGIL